MSYSGNWKFDNSKIQKRLTSLAMTRQDLADATGLSETGIRRAILPGANISTEYLLKIARGLCVRPAYFFKKEKYKK